MTPVNTNTDIFRLRKALARGYSALKRRSFLGPHLFAATLFFSLLTLLILLEEIFYFPAAVKTAVIVALAVLSGIIYFNISRPKVPDKDFRAFYRRFCAAADQYDLNYALDLLSDAAGDSSALKQAAIADNISRIDFEAAKNQLEKFIRNDTVSIRYRTARYSVFMSLLILAVSAVYFFSGLQRAAVFWKSYSPPNPYSYVVSPGDVTLEQGASFSVQAQFLKDEMPKALVLKVKSRVEKEFRTYRMQFADSAFRSESFEINNDLEYYVEMDGFKSELYEVDVQLRPRFKELAAVLVPPAYTKSDTIKKIYPFSVIETLQGTEIRIEGTANKKLDEALILTGGRHKPLVKTDSTEYSLSLTAMQQDTLSFMLSDYDGLTNSNPFRIIVSPAEDEYPVIEILEPARSFEMAEPKQVEIVYKAADDFGLTSAVLHYEIYKAYVEQPAKGRVNLTAPLNGVLQNFMWKVDGLGLTPLDEMRFWIEVSDNDEFRGYKTSKSQEITLKVPSLIDYFESLNESESDVSTSLDEVSDSFSEMQDMYESFKESLKENPETNYEQHKQLDNIKNKREDLERQIEDLNKKFEDIKNEINENQLLSKETQQAYKELQDLLEEINDPALKDALEKLQEQMQRFTPEQLRKAMQEVEFNEEAYKDRINRTIELFKRLKLMSDLEKLAVAFEDKAEQEKKLKDNPPGKDELDKKRRQDEEQLEKLQDALKKLDDYTSPRNQKAIDEYREMTEGDLEYLKNKMQQDTSGESGSGEGMSETYEDEYSRMAERTRKAIEGASAQQLNLNLAGLRHVLYNLLTLSEEQEDLVNGTETAESNSSAFVEFARSQQNIQRIFNVVADSLTQIAAEVQQFSNDIAKKKLEVKAQLERSLEYMTERNNRNSSVASRQAFGGINEIAFLIANLLDQIQEQESGSGGEGEMSLQQMIEQLGKTGEEQQELNRQLQDMINDLQGERLSQDQMQRLEQMARQQNEIRKQIEEMQRNGGMSGDKINSELQRMTEEMEDMINDLRGGAVDRNLIRRQQNILSRMLQSEKALEEREEEEERESKTGDDKLRAIPPNITLEELEKQIRSRLNDPNFTKYSSDYQRLIERYFELLYKLEQENIP